MWSEAAGFALQALIKTADEDTKDKLIAVSDLVRLCTEALDGVDMELRPILKEMGAKALDMNRVAEVLGFYADHTNYAALRNFPSEVMQDRGEQAREVLEKLSGDDEGK